MSAELGSRPAGAGVRYGRDSVEFARVVNLSDAVFAIAMTLLVLGLEVPDVRAERLGAELAAVLPQLAAFVLGFALVANIWWQHHKLFARLAFADRGLVAIDLVLLGAVALVPFPTGVLGRHPLELAAVLPFTGVFVLLVALFLTLVVHAERQAAWVTTMPPAVFPWVVAGYVVVIVTMLAAAVLAFRSPLAALLVLAISSLPEVALARRAPPGYREWS
jgi:uncharacterized membrane protein